MVGEKPTDDTNVEVNKQCALMTGVHTPPAVSGQEVIVRFSRADYKQRTLFKIKEGKSQNT